MTESRVAIVTGAAQGMGAACVARLAADGARVVSMDLKEARAQNGAIAYVGDVTSAADVDAAVELARFLVAEEASYITGAALDINGGDFLG